MHHDVVSDAVAAEGVVDGAGVVSTVLPSHGLHLEVRLEPEDASFAAGIPRPADGVNRNLLDPEFKYVASLIVQF